MNYIEKQKELDEEFEKDFEANMLDGSPVNDCGGAMLSAAGVLEYFTEQSYKRDKVLLEWAVEEIGGMKITKECHIDSFAGIEKQSINDVITDIITKLKV